MNNFPPIANRNTYNSPSANDNIKHRNMIHSQSDFITSSSNKAEYKIKLIL